MKIRLTFPLRNKFNYLFSGIWSLFFLSFSGSSWALKEVPSFQPNVVDEARILNQNEVQEINRNLELIRVKADIWGAAHIVNSLQGESIESYSERVFRKWELGDKVKDNGLLLVISMQDRKSRLEVGYGLEGDLTDVSTRKVLDFELAPLMRKGKTKQAIIKVFNTLALYKVKDPQLSSEFSNKLETMFPEQMEVLSLFTRNSGFMGEDGNHLRGLLAWAFFLIALWVFPLLTTLRQNQLVERLEQIDPFFKRNEDPFLPKSKSLNEIKLRNNPSPMIQKMLKKSMSRGVLGAFGIKAFLSINPGIFIFFGGSLLPIIYTAGFILLCLFFSYLHFRYKTARYRSKQAHDKYIQKQKKKHADMVKLGHMLESSPGVFEFTAKYFSSPEYKASRRSSSSRSSSSWSSSSSSSFSSSSGGGSSGGGGSSSSW